MTKTYRGSDGQMHAIDKMQHNHLVSSHAKLVREQPHRVAEIADMAAQIAENETVFRAKIEMLKAEGYFIREAPGGFFGFPPGGSMQVSVGKTEDAAWAKLIAHRAARAE